MPEAGPYAPVLRDAIPLYRINPTPEYPRIARRRGYNGTVVLKVLVNKYGRVSHLKIFESSGYSVLDKSALRSVKNWLFEPGMKGNINVGMWVMVPIRFRLD